MKKISNIILYNRMLLVFKISIKENLHQEKKKVLNIMEYLNCKLLNKLNILNRSKLIDLYSFNILYF